MLLDRIQFLLFSLSISAWIFTALETQYLLKRGVGLGASVYWALSTSFIGLLAFAVLFLITQSLWRWLKQQHLIQRLMASPLSYLLFLFFFSLVFLIEWSSKKYLANESFQRVFLISALLCLTLFISLLSVYWLQRLQGKTDGKRYQNEPSQQEELDKLGELNAQKNQRKLSAAWIELLRFVGLVLLLCLGFAYVIQQEWTVVRELSYPRWGLLILSFFITHACLLLISLRFYPSPRLLKISHLMAILPMLSFLSIWALPSSWIKDKKLETLSLANVCSSCDFYYKRHLKVMNQQQVNVGTCDVKYPAWRVTEKKEPNPELPDIILVTIDALRQDQTSLFNPKIPYTPELLKLAQNAVVFDYAYSPSGSTRQSIKAIFTGIYSSLSLSPSVKRWALSINDQQETLAHYLQSNGYYTTALISAKGTFGSQGRALLGFDEIDLSLHWTYKNLKYVNPYQIDKIIGSFSNPQRRPHFLWTHILDSHQPYAVSPSLPKLGRAKIDLYHTVVSQIDQNLKRLIDFVQSPERKNRTWLIITADHGQSFNEHGQGAHIHGMSAYQEEIHVPLLVYGPNTKGMRIKTPVQLVDLFPTIFELAGLENPKFSCGKSLMPLIRGDQMIPGELIERGIWVEQHSDSSKQERSAAYFWKGYKLVFSPNQQRIELFHLNSDPKEKNDLSQKEPKVFEEMKAKCKEDMGSKQIDILPYMTW